MFRLTRTKYIAALESAEELQRTLETEMENLESSNVALSNNWFGLQAESNCNLMNTSLRDGNHRKALAYTAGMTEIMGEYLPEIEKMMAKREQIGRQLNQDSYYIPDLSKFCEEQLMINYEYIDDVKVDAEGAVHYGNKAVRLLEEMIEDVQACAGEYVELTEVRELLEKGRRKLQRIENYRDEFEDFGKKMSDLEYNMSYDLSKRMEEQAEEIFLNTSMGEVELRQELRIEHMDECDEELFLSLMRGEYGEKGIELFQPGEDGKYLFEGLLKKEKDELTEEEIEALARLYEDAYEQVRKSEDCKLSADIVRFYTENLFQFTMETKWIDHYYVSAKEGLIQAILDKVDCENETVIYSLENLKGTKIEVKKSWFESSWEELGNRITEIDDFRNSTNMIGVTLIKTDLGIQTVLYAYPAAGKRDEHMDEGYKVIYEKELYELPLLERCARSGYIMTREEEKQVEKEVKEYFSSDRNKLALDMATNFGIDIIFDSSKADYTPEELEEFRQMYLLNRKTNDLDAFTYSVNSNFILTKPFVYGGILDRLTGYPEYGSHEREYLEMAIEQNKFTNMAGSILGEGASYLVGAAAMKKIPGAGKILTGAGEKLSKIPVIGKIGAESLTNILADTTLDTAIDTIPSMVEVAIDGGSAGEVAEEGVKKSLINIGANGAFETAFRVGKGVLGGVSKSGSISVKRLEIIDGRVDGKIPIADYEKYRVASVHNPNSDTMTLGKYEPTIRPDGTKDFSVPGPGAYTVKAGDTTYFSLGTDWDKITDTYGLDAAGKNMFDYFNKPALDDAVNAGKEIRFSHDPEGYGECALKWEWDYLQDEHGYFALEKRGEFWYAIK